MPKITELFAFVATEHDKGEGIMGWLNPETKQWMPLVGADMARVESLKATADYISKVSEVPYRILKFKLVGEIPK